MLKTSLVVMLICAIIGVDAYAALRYLSSRPVEETEVAITTDDLDSYSELDDGLLANGGDDAAADPNHKQLPLVYDVPGIDEPEMLPVTEAKLTEASKVIGVVIDGQQYAFSLDSMVMETNHIVNFVTNQTSLSVVYCPLADCVRVLRCDEGELIPMRLGGLNEDGLMAVLLKGTRYDLDSPRIPLTDYAFERTSYGQWKQKYPQTKVFTNQSIPKRARRS